MIKKFLIILSLIITIFTPIYSVSALDETTLQIFAQNDIIGYNPECSTTNNGTDPGTRYRGNSNKYGHWDGHCNNISHYYSWLEKQYNTVVTVASKYKLPWETFLAQAIAEGGAGRSEVCPYNSLGIRAYSGGKTCDGVWAQFDSYEDMWNKYATRTVGLREGQGKFPQDPYSLVEFIQYGATYAYCTEGCPNYVSDVSAYICGIQKWAESNNHSTSAVTYNNFSSGTTSNNTPKGDTTSTTPSKNSEYCEEDDSDTGPTGDDIAKQAVKLAWPYTTDDGADKADKCDPDGSGNLVNYDGKYTNSVCRTNPKPAYKAALAQVWGNSEANKGCTSSGGPCDCTRFTTTVILSGGFDDKFPKGTSGTVLNYLTGDDGGDGPERWSEVDINNLQPGDVLAKNGHTYIYVGKYGGNWGNTAQASQGTTVGVVTKDNNPSGFRAFRIKSKGKCQFNNPDGTGCTFYCQGGGESWANTSYGNCGGDDTYAWAGCGPTALAMVITNLTGKKVTPDTIGNKATAVGGRVCGSGSVAANIITIVKDYGLKYETIGWSVNDINDALDQGKVIYLSGKGSSPFSSQGHFIAIRGKTSNGKWLLFNSAGGCKKDQYTPSKTEYNPSDIITAASSSHTGPYAISK